MKKTGIPIPLKNGLDINEINNMMEQTMGASSAFFNDLLKAQDCFNNIPEDQKVSIDPFGCEKIFVAMFIKDKMCDDFNLVIRDFLIHEFANLNNYDNIEYYDVESGDDFPEDAFHKYMLSLMVNAVNGGSEYTKSLLIYLYKTYYRKEYRALKRFSTLSAGELLSLAKPDGYESMFWENLARILYISKLKGIKIAPDCNFAYGFLNDFASRVLPKAKYEFYKATGDSFKKCCEEVKERFNMQEMYRLDAKASKFLGNALKWLGYHPAYVDWCDDNARVTEEDIGFALSVFKNTFPDKECSLEELVLYSMIIHAASAATCNNDRTIDIINDLIYGEKSLFYEDFPPDFKPEDVMDCKSIPEQKPQVKADVKPVGKATDKVEYNEDALLNEIDNLRRKLHKAESDISALRTELANKKKLEGDKDSLREELDSASRELAALKNYVYNLTEDEDTTDDISYVDMKGYLKTLRIVIVGGHTKWVAKMKTEFPDWKFVNPTVSGAADTAIVDKADYVFFFSDTISHSTYYRYLNILRERKIGFGYIHGVNMENGIKQLYRELKEGVR